MKYKNTSGFRSVVVISGKKTIVFPDDVIDYPGELFNASFDKVADDASITHKDRAIKKPSQQNNEQFSQLQDKLTEVKKDTDSILEETNSKTSSEINELRKEIEAFKGLVIKRMEILKSAVQTLEYELSQVLYDENEENAVAAEDKSAKPFRNNKS
jgi:ElaB/YqjD/DUF883 family membrane-anchored ribosome-binding protein